MMTTQRALRQLAFWPPAFAALVALSLLAVLLGRLHAAGWLKASYAVVATVLIWWLAPRLAFRTWCDGTHLHWRWGMLHRDAARRVALADIVRVEVATMPDRPLAPLRTVDGIELHGGAFTPSLNRGVLLVLRDGRRLCLGVSDPERFAASLRAVLGYDQ